MITYKKALLGILATAVTVLYFWYLGYNVMILDNPLVTLPIRNINHTLVQVGSWE